MSIFMLMDQRSSESIRFVLEIRNVRRMPAHDKPMALSTAGVSWRLSRMIPSASKAHILRSLKFKLKHPKIAGP